jgi:GTP-binding protein
VSAQCFSSLKNTGIDELKAKLQSWLAPGENIAGDEEIPSV